MHIYKFYFYQILLHYASLALERFKRDRNKTVNFVKKKKKKNYFIVFIAMCIYMVHTVHFYSEFANKLFHYFSLFRNFHCDNKIFGEIFFNRKSCKFAYLLHSVKHVPLHKIKRCSSSFETICLSIQSGRGGVRGRGPPVYKSTLSG